MKKWTARTRRRMLVIVLLSLSAWIVSQLLLRNLYRFLAFDAQFCAIFSQILDGKMRCFLPAVILPAWVYSLPAARLGERGRWGRFVAIALGIPVWLLLVAVAMYVTRVNGVLFGDVLVSLMDVLQKGGLG